MFLQQSYCERKLKSRCTLSGGYNKTTKMYHQVSYAKKGLYKQQKKMAYKSWYGQKQELQRLIDFLNFLMVVTKSFGDAFVFTFYSLDREYLNKHLEAPAQQLTLPTGVGGLGEMEFVKNFKLLNGQVVLYHGITNILRIGDFTLFDVKEGKVAAVGELKSGMPDKETLNFNLTIIGHKSRGMDFDKPSKIDHAEEQKEPFAFPNKERYAKQIKTMADSFKFLDRKEVQDDQEPNFFFSKPKFDVMAELASVSSDIPISYSQVENGLVLARFAYDGGTIFERFMTLNNESNINKEELQKHVMKVLRNDLENSLAFGQIHFNSKLRIDPLQGTKPIFWYPIKNDVLKKIYFGEIIFFTIYNVGFLTKAMKEKGYEYGFSEKHKMKGFIKKENNAHYFVSGIPFFVRLITDYLQDESVVLESIDSASLSLYSQTKGSGSSGKANMDIILQ